jgi:3-hydroxyacyl-CoA dehydrogenase
MKKIGIIGAGNMGGGIAQKTAQEGLSVILVDTKPEFVESGKYLQDQDPLAEKTAKIIAGKAPLALRFANQIMDEGFKLPVSEAVKLELVHLNEIFSTADALTGLSSVGKGKPTFVGK